MITTFMSMVRPTCGNPSRPAWQKVSNRHIGAGPDGPLIPPTTGGSYLIRMRMFNADGTEGRMCGNASRCGQICSATRDWTAKTNSVAGDQTAEGAETLHLKDRAVDSVAVDMGEPIH